MGEENSTAVFENEAVDFEGAGDEDDPYLIEDVDDLKKLRVIGFWVRNATRGSEVWKEPRM